MKKLTAILVIIICLVDIAKSQDPLFSQYFVNSLDLNPAFVGTANDPRVMLHYRNQWPGAFGRTFATYQGSYDQYIKSISGGIGFNILRDNLFSSVLTATNIDMIYCYHAKISRTFTLQSALQFTFQFENFNPAGLAPLNNEVLSSSQITKPDFAIGFLGRSRYSQIGLSVHHLNSGYVKFNYAFIKTPLKISLFYSRNIKIYNKDKVQENGFILSPAIMIQNQAQSYVINYGTNFIFGDFLTGFWMRNNLPFQFTSIIFNVGYTFTNLKRGNICVIYSYDYELPSLNNMMPVTGAHEVSVVLTLPTDPKRKRYGPVKCPDDLY
jgi:type IX secretion system PorP/SprF family membrane protein